MLYLKKYKYDRNVSHRLPDNDQFVSTEQTKTAEQLKSESIRLQRWMKAQDKEEVISLIEQYPVYLLSYSPYYPD